MMAEHLDKLIWFSHQDPGHGSLARDLRGEQGQRSLGASQAALEYKTTGCNIIGLISPKNVESSKKGKVCFVMNDRVLKGLSGASHWCFCPIIV